ncbi:MAG: response regulator [Hyphomicrobiales bacterium]|nr:response regulator [Hyphomicrobiales bacterium]
MANLSVLIVDDDRDIADTLAYIVKRSGYDVTVAYDGESAVAHATESEFDIAFIDIMLPGMDGAENLAQIRQLNPDVQAYMMTGYSARESKAKAIDAGAIDILCKPVMPEDILGKLSKADKGTILIADDDPVFAELVSTTLHTAGWNVRTAETGLQAVDIVSHGGITAMVLDYSMPILSGTEVCRELTRRGIDLPIIVATSDENSRGLFEHLNIDGFLRKPVDPRAVLEFVERQSLAA